jgi:hypothetical protein
LKKISSIIIILLSLIHIGTAQSIPLKRFVSNGGLEKITIEFKKDSLFEYRFSSCTRGEFGKGIYDLSHSILTLTFTEKIIDTNSYTPNISQISTNNDTTNLALSLFDVKRRNFVTNFNLRIGSKGRNVNNDSILIYKIPNRELPIEIEVTSLGFARSKLKIDSAGNYRIIIKGKSVFNKEIENGRKLRYLVQKATRTKLILCDPEIKKKKIVLNSFK